MTLAPILPSALDFPKVIRVDERGLTILADISQEEAEAYALGMDLGDDALNWSRGDLVLYSQQHWGEEAAQVIPTGKEERWLDYARISDMYRREERIFNVSWSHYKLVRKLPDRDVWLKKAQDEGLSYEQLKNAMQGNIIPARKNSKQELARVLDFVERALEYIEAKDYELAKERLREALNG